MDIHKIKGDFPLLKNNPNLIYLDNAATTQKPQVVINAISDFYAYYNANPFRSIYPLAEQATTLFEDARQTVARFINALPEEVIFNSGATEGINCIADTWGREHIKAGDEIVITMAEHHANFLPWQRLAKQTGAHLKYIELDTTTYTFKYPPHIITPKTKLVAVTLDSNVLGPVWDTNQLQTLINDAHVVGAKVLIDAAQRIPHERIDVQKLGADFLVFSGHKMVGPTGIGVLYIKKETATDMTPYKVGGSMVYSVGIHGSIWQKAPTKFEAGTPPIAAAIGLKAAIDYLTTIDFEALKKHEASLCARLLEGLEAIEGIRILGNIERIRASGHLVSFEVSGLHGHDIAHYVAMNNIAVRAGHHCAQPLADTLNVAASVRASFYMYNTPDQIDVLVNTLKQAIKVLR